jgi:hypothetical protein
LGKLGERSYQQAPWRIYMGKISFYFFLTELTASISSESETVKI